MSTRLTMADQLPNARVRHCLVSIDGYLSAGVSSNNNACDDGNDSYTGGQVTPPRRSSWGASAC